MAYKITDACVSCGTCVGECPVGAIAEGDGKYDIDADACVSRLRLWRGRRGGEWGARGAACH